MTDNRTALVVDDVTTNRVLARALLAKTGWQVDEAADGAAALGKAAGTAYRLILLDISMPGLSGEETCRALRAGGASGTLIVAYTAHAFADERRRILAAGFDDILVKPVNLQSMAELMQRLSL